MHFRDRGCIRTLHPLFVHATAFNKYSYRLISMLSLGRTKMSYSSLRITLWCEELQHNILLTAVLTDVVPIVSPSALIENR